MADIKNQVANNVATDADMANKAKEIEKAKAEIEKAEAKIEPLKAAIEKASVAEKAAEEALAKAKEAKTVAGSELKEKQKAVKDGEKASLDAEKMAKLQAACDKAAEKVQKTTDKEVEAKEKLAAKKASSKEAVKKLSDKEKEIATLNKGLDKLQNPTVKTTKAAAPKAEVAATKTENVATPKAEKAEKKAEAPKAEKASKAEKAPKVATKKETVGDITRLKSFYESEVVPALVKKFGFKNINEVPKLEKIVINTSLGDVKDNQKSMQIAIEELKAIAGQKPLITTAKKSIANFKVREGMNIGAKVTLRGEMMYQFFDKLISIALPRVRDFRGVPAKSFDGRGNYAMGVKEQLIFPEISYEKVEKTRGFDICVVTTAKTDEHAKGLLALMGMPFRAN